MKFMDKGLWVVGDSVCMELAGNERPEEVPISPGGEELQGAITPAGYLLQPGVQEPPRKKRQVVASEGDAALDPHGNSTMAAWRRNMIYFDRDCERAAENSEHTGELAGAIVMVQPIPAETGGGPNAAAMIVAGSHVIEATREYAKAKEELLPGPVPDTHLTLPT